MIQRTLNLLKILDNKTSAFLFGARGTGKSSQALTFLDHQSTHGMLPFQINLLESETYEQYLKQPDLFRRELIQLKCFEAFIWELDDNSKQWRQKLLRVQS